VKRCRVPRRQKKEKDQLFNPSILWKWSLPVGYSEGMARRFSSVLMIVDNHKILPPKPFIIHHSS